MGLKLEQDPEGAVAQQKIRKLQSEFTPKQNPVQGIEQVDFVLPFTKHGMSLLLITS